jgi:AraC-like DNA-binding protein
MRVEEGARLLTEGSATVTDVAYAVGFNSLSYFCRCFQQAYGVTPAAYRLSKPITENQEPRAHHS